MFKTASKFLFGLSVFGFVAAFVYAGATGHNEIGMSSLIGPITFGYKGYVGEHVGYAVLMGLAIASLCGGIVFATIGDADPEAAAAALGLDAVPEVPVPSTANYWPVVAAFSLAAIALGLAVGSTIFVIGVIGLVATTIEWAVRNWSDRATGDPEVNAAIRDRTMHPVEIPVGAAIAIAALVLCVSRVMLAVPHRATYFVFGIAPMVVLAIGIVIAVRPKMSSSAIAGLLLIFGIAVLGAGIVAGIHGERGEKEEKEHESKGVHRVVPMPAPHATVIRVGG
jgi:hypothetical protein